MEHDNQVQVPMTPEDYLDLIRLMIEILDKALSLMSEDAIAQLAQEMGLPMSAFIPDAADELDSRSIDTRVAGLTSQLSSIAPKGSC